MLLLELPGIFFFLNVFNLNWLNFWMLKVRILRANYTTIIIVFKKLIFNTMFPQSKLYIVRYFSKLASDKITN